MSLQKVKITKVSYTNKRKDGTPLISKFGKSYYRVGLLCQEFGSQWLNGFLNFEPKDWIDKIMEFEIQEEEYMGQRKLVFRLPSPWKITKDMWEILLEKVKHLEEVANNKEAVIEDEIDPGSIPF